MGVQTGFYSSGSHFLRRTFFSKNKLGVVSKKWELMRISAVKKDTELFSEEHIIIKFCYTV